MLSFAAQGLSAFVRRDGKMRLIFGAELEEDEVEALRNGYEMREMQARLSLRLIQCLDHIDDSLFHRRLELLSFLVASGQLDLKLALRKKGMYHEKIGIFTDEAGYQLAFQGSANETFNALNPDFNFESIHVYPSWKHELDSYFSPVLKGFEGLWSDQTRNIKVIPFPEAIRDYMHHVVKQGVQVASPAVELELVEKGLDIQNESRLNTVCPRIPETYSGMPYELRRHQRMALEAWQANHFRGIFNHATGAGKTITAIHGICKIFEALQRRNCPLALVIAVPYVDLADQWAVALREFGINPIRCYDGIDKWREDLLQALDLFPTNLHFLPILVVNATLQSESFQAYLKKLDPGVLMWIGDECHHHTTENLSGSLPEAHFRLGLSATPFHSYDEVKSDAVRGFYGDVVSTYDLEHALTDGVLTPYEYFIHRVPLTESETIEYMELSRQISEKAFLLNDEASLYGGSEALKFLMFKRARLLGGAELKTQVLAKILENTPPQPHTLFYCSENLQIEDGPPTQIQTTIDVLNQMGWKTSSFTSNESRSERKSILKSFSQGLIDGMIAIRCLDEGIDVPACRTAFILASSRNPRQFIQRRGRILRRCYGKEKAIIHDFFVEIPKNFVNNSILERKLYSSELLRVGEFSKLSMNPEKATQELKDILIDFNLSHLLI